MKRLTILLALFLLSAFSAVAQKLANHGLVVTGSVQKVEAKCVEGKPVIAVAISLQMRNDSSTPLIFIRDFGISTTKFKFVSTTPGASEKAAVAANVVRYNPYQEDPFGPGTPNDYDRIADLVKHPERWEHPKPIEPGGYFESLMEIWLTTGFTLSPKATEAFKACKPVDETPVPDYPVFYLEHRTSLKKYANGDDVMRLLAFRWKSIGVLPLDSRGDISYLSEPIIFPLTK